jgi:hypothetical protein
MSSAGTGSGAPLPSVAGGGRAFDAAHRAAGVGHDHVVGIGDHPGRGGVTAAAPPRVSTQPLVSTSSPLPNWSRLWQRASSGAGRCSSVKPAELPLVAQCCWEPLIDLRRTHECLAERDGSSLRQANAGALRLHGRNLGAMRRTPYALAALSTAQDPQSTSGLTDRSWVPPRHDVSQPEATQGCRGLSTVPGAPRGRAARRSLR